MFWHLACIYYFRKIRHRTSRALADRPCWTECLNYMVSQPFMFPMTLSISFFFYALIMLLWFDLNYWQGSKTTARRLQPGSMSTHPANIRHTNYALHHGYCHFKSSLLSRIQTMLTVGKAGELMSAVDESPLPLLLGMNSLLVLAELPEPFYL